MVSRKEKMALQRTGPELYITECTLIYEDKWSGQVREIVQEMESVTLKSLRQIIEDIMYAGKVSINPNPETKKPKTKNRKPKPVTRSPNKARSWKLG